MTHYKLVATGGTFDRLHKGHEFLLRNAFAASDKVIIGLTSDAIVKNKRLSKIIKPYSKRLVDLREFLKKNNWLSRTRIVKLNDSFGPAVINNKVEAIICTSSTLEGAKLINKERFEKGLTKARIIKVKLVKGQDGKHISSSRIRLGKEDRSGVVYAKKLVKKIRFSSADLKKFKKPWGELVETSRAKERIKELKPTLVVLVGDVVFKNLKNIAKAAVIDFKNKRKEFKHSVKSLLYAENPAGTITPSLVKALQKAIVNGGVVKVDGEEDLAVIPAVLISPLESVVVYGQPNRGVVLVKVTEETKKKFYSLIKT
ncbi:pantetheine-phosphate adenylyltransferase [Candidatus Micrarchaeota archaeon]|nr:pantetheine-phosphate adenylyltransferase [Candidatus Micrarchaeota archaeon]